MATQSNSEDIFIREGCRYPKVKVQLTGEDGNGFYIILRVRAALKEAGVSIAERADFTEEAMAGDYVNLIGTVCGWVDAR